MARDLEAFVNDAVGHSEIVVNSFSQRWPACSFAWTSVLVHQTGQDACTIALDRIDVAEETIALLCEDCGCELLGRLNEMIG